jgi:4-carboxymuconolactone decarboxylase
MIGSNADVQQPEVSAGRYSPGQVRAVAPALEQYTRERLHGEVWKRPGLSRRDRSLVTIAALIARGQAPALSYYAEQALDNGVTPREISETIVHLAYYSGWSNAMAAVGPVGEVYSSRRIPGDQLPSESTKSLELDEAAESQRAKNVAAQFGAVAPGLVHYTTEYLFRDLWLRPDLAPRDRSLVTVAALVSSGQVAQITFHLNRAMDNGLTQEQAAEVITHLAFYAGWPNAMSALPVAKEVFARRASAAANQ